MESVPSEYVFARPLPHQADISPTPTPYVDPDDHQCLPLSTTSDCETDKAGALRAYLPGAESYQTYFDHAPIGQRPVRPSLKRSWMTCEQLSQRQTTDATHNDLNYKVVHTPLIDPTQTLGADRECDDWTPSDHPLYRAASTECLNLHHASRCAATWSDQMNADWVLNQTCSSFIPSFPIKVEPDEPVLVTERVKEQRRIIEQNNQRICQWTTRLRQTGPGDSHP